MVCRIRTPDLPFTVVIRSFIAKPCDGSLTYRGMSSPRGKRGRSMDPSWSIPRSSGGSVAIPIGYTRAQPLEGIRVSPNTPWWMVQLDCVSNLSSVWICGCIRLFRLPKRVIQGLWERIELVSDCTYSFTQVVVLNLSLTLRMDIEDPKSVRINALLSEYPRW
jgi:hypothetical protein